VKGKNNSMVYNLSAAVRLMVYAGGKSAETDLL
jgi:hypothetical protein